MTQECRVSRDDLNSKKIAIVNCGRTYSSLHHKGTLIFNIKLYKCLKNLTIVIVLLCYKKRKYTKLFKMVEKEIIWIIKL